MLGKVYNNLIQFGDQTFHIHTNKIESKGKPKPDSSPVQSLAIHEFVFLNFNSLLEMDPILLVDSWIDFHWHVSPFAVGLS